MSIKVQLRAGARGTAEVTIYDPIGQDWFGDGVTAKKFRKDLEALGPVSEIVVRINSPGGAVFDGVAIYNALKENSARIVVHVDGLAASIASMIAMAGDEIVMHDGAMMMIHDPWMFAVGDAEDMRKAADMLEKVGSGLIDAYEKRTKKSRSQIEEWMKAETWFTADEAVEHGFATARADAEEDDADERQLAALLHSSAFATPEKFRAFAMARVSPPPQVTAGSPESASADATTHEVTTMPEKATPSATPADIQAAEAAAREKALKEEGDRQTSIRAKFAPFKGAHQALLDDCLKDQKCTPEQASEKLLAKLGEGAEPMRPTGAIVTAGADARDKFLIGAGQAILVRGGYEKREEGNEFSGMRISEIAAHALQLVGVQTRGLTRAQLASKIFAAQSTSDFPQLLSNTAGKVLRKAYGNFPNTWNKTAAAGEVSDFKVHPRIQMGSFESLATIEEGGEYKYSGAKEEYENAQAKTKGRAIRFTRQALINDDLGGFMRRAALLGRAAARSVNNDYYAYVTSGANNRGPTLADGGQYFNATAPTETGSGHGNLLTSGTAISVTNLGLMRTAMRRQKDKSVRETLNIEPKVLLCSVQKEDLALEVVRSRTKDGQSNSEVVNVHQNRFEVVADPALDAVAANPWFLFADPMDVAAFEVVFLEGVQEPFIDEMIQFTTDSLDMKARLDYGIAPGDWRAARRNEGA